MNKLPDFSKARLLVVGDVMLDRYWFGDVDRISPEAPVPVVRWAKTEERPGGAANVACNAGALGASVALLSVVGDDEPGRSLRKLIESNKGVRANLHKDESIATTVKLRVLARNQQLLRVDFETPPSHEVLLGKLAEYRALLPECDVVILSDYGKGGLLHVEQMIRLASEQGKKVLVDPKGDDYSKYQGATLVTPNVKELREVVGTWKSEEELEERAEKLRQQLGLDALLLTRGKDGMSLYQAGGVQHQPAQAREVSDVSGAGDTVIAALGAMLGCGESLKEAMQLANLAGGIKVGKLGTAVVHPHELAAALAASNR